MARRGPSSLNYPVDERIKRTNFYLLLFTYSSYVKTVYFCVREWSIL